MYLFRIISLLKSELGVSVTLFHRQKPVVNGSYPLICQEILREFAERKGFEPPLAEAKPHFECGAINQTLPPLRTKSAII